MLRPSTRGRVLGTAYDKVITDPALTAVESVSVTTDPLNEVALTEIPSSPATVNADAGATALSGRSNVIVSVAPSTSAVSTSGLVVGVLLWN